MATLIFIRNSCTYDCWDYYDKKTEVWVFGDLDGYNLFRQDILLAVTKTTNTHIPFLDRNPISMRGIILPAQVKYRQFARIKLIERFVTYDGNPSMELVIAGNEKGYHYLAEKLAFLINSENGNVEEYIKFDDLTDPAVVKRSVALNVRAPLKKWSVKKLGEYAVLLKKKSEYFIPLELQYRLNISQAYVDINTNESPVVRI
jgi:hypothetical protein